MILQRTLDAPCPRCGTKGTFGVLFVTRDQLIRGCKHCQQTDGIPLPELRKTVLYLDQCFHSSAFRANNKEYVKRVERIRDLASRQLLVCPWSNVHEIETHQWPDTKQQALWDFIKRTGVGHKFSHSVSIQHAQLEDRFSAFLKDEKSKVLLDPRDAFESDVHNWDGFVWVDVRGRFDDSAAVKQGKIGAMKQMIAAFDTWRAKPQSFAADIRAEWVGYAKAVIDDYIKHMFQRDFSNPLAILPSGSAAIVNLLMVYQGHQEPIETRFDRVRQFLLSDWFANVPFVDASCRLTAALRRAVRRGELVKREKAERAMYGFGQDMEMISIFAPYVDAVFMDSQIHRWITEPDCDLPQAYGFRAFSARNWGEFDSFLDDIEHAAPKDHAAWLKIVYE